MFGCYRFFGSGTLFYMFIGTSSHLQNNIDSSHLKLKKKTNLSFEYQVYIMYFLYYHLFFFPVVASRQSLVGCCLWGHTELDMTEVT